MNPLQQITKVLRKHNAQLLIEHHQYTAEILLSIPAHIAANGDIFAYATEYRLGQSFPQYAPAPPAPPRQTPLLDDDEFEEIKP